MKSDGGSDRVLDLSFIGRGRAEATSPFTGTKSPIHWDVRSIAKPLWPISLVECHMAGFGAESFGYGDGVFFKDSLRQAFSESWERLWFHVLAGCPEASPVKASSSNGFACGRTETAALCNAQNELFERAIFLSAWQTRTGWRRLQLLGVSSRLMCAPLLHSGWSVRFFSVRESRLGDVICGFAFKESGGAVFDSCFASRLTDEGAAQRKVLRSLMRSVLLGERRGRVLTELPDVGRPQDHAAFYWNPKNVGAFTFLDDVQHASEIVLGHYEATTARVLVDLPDFPIVAFAANDKWPQLSWGRRALPAGGNPWPHPLA